MDVQMAEEPSFAQAPAEMVHREQQHAHQHPNHRSLHRRRVANSDVVARTVANINKLEIANDGQVIDTLNDLATGTASEATTGGVTGSSATPSPALSNGLVSSTSASVSSISSQTVLTATPYATAVPIGRNSTSNSTLSSGFHSSNQTVSSYGNATRSSNSSASATLFILPSASSSASLSYTYTTTGSLSTTSFSSSSTGTGTFSGTSSSATATSSSGAGIAGIVSNASGNTPSGGVIAGGVVGGVAGLTLLVFLAFLLLRWKRGTSVLRDGNDSSNTRALTGDTGPMPTSSPMAKRAGSLGFAVPAAIAAMGEKRRSEQSRGSAEPSTAASERGFYRVSGRKIASVLESGGDGYGNAPPTNRDTISSTATGTGTATTDHDNFDEKSFYRDSRGTYGGTGSPTSPISPTSPVAMAGPLSSVTAGFTEQRTRDSAPIVAGRSPARTPIINQGPFADPVDFDRPLRRPDFVGRSHPSQDGSRGSRFFENV